MKTVKHMKLAVRLRNGVMIYADKFEAGLTEDSSHGWTLTYRGQWNVDTLGAMTGLITNVGVIWPDGRERWWELRGISTQRGDSLKLRGSLAMLP